MFLKSSLCFVAMSVLLASEQVLGRETWLERNNRAVHLRVARRRFGQEQPAVLQKISAACPGQICGTLAGQAVTPLLAAQPECSQQDMADAIIDASKQFDVATQANMIALAVEYRQVEKNTPPDFTTNPPTLRNSVFCQKAPKNPQLNGLVQAQDPANDPNIFFDPATSATVKKGAQANTFPFGNSSSIATPAAVTSATAVTSTSAVTVSATIKSIAAASSAKPVLVDEHTTTPCPATVTITISGTNPAATFSNAITISIGGSAATSTVVPTGTASPSIGNFGKCSVPQIEFGVGFDNRKETSFEPVDKTSFAHGSAQNIDIITQFICDTLTNTCGADQTAKDTCATAKAAADTVTAKTGGQADVFNAAFGIKTNFAAIASVDDQGNVVAGTGSGSAAASSVSASASAVATTAAQSLGLSASVSSAAAPVATGVSSAVGNFGKCSVPEIQFGVGFDNRKETSFEPVDQTSFAHGSAQNIDIITQFICDTLTNSCGADQTAKDTCTTAKAAADTVTAKTGGQADAFNAAFGIQTNFAAVAEVDSQGNVVAGTGSGATDSTASAVAPTPPTATAAATTSAAAPVSTASPVSGNLQVFTGALGGVVPPSVTDLGDGQFQVTGNSAFNDKQSALVRSCDVQHNQCANAANASGNKGDLTVAACGEQQNQCNAANGA